jgi:hypothetical protein
LRHVDDSPTALSYRLENLVAANAVAVPFGKEGGFTDVMIQETGIGRAWGGGFKKGVLAVVLEEAIDGGAQGGVTVASLVQEGSALLRGREVQRVEKEVSIAQVRRSGLVISTCHN